MAIPYSYHTFLFPFIWEGRGKHSVTLKEFKGYFDNNPHWVDISMTDEYRMTESSQFISDRDAFLFFKEYEYFHPYARKAIFGFADDVVTNYSFRPEGVRNKGHYYIEKNGRTYDLLLNAVKLKIYNTGVAIFILEAENHGLDTDGGSQANLDSVKAINDFGRRVSLPFIPEDPDGYSCTADSLRISIDGVGDFTTDFRETIRSVRTAADFQTKISLMHFCDFIKRLLTFGDYGKVTSRHPEDPSRFFIYPALDDRMFVASYIQDSKEIDAFRQRNEEGLPAYIWDPKLSKSLYELIIVDPPNGCCCQDPNMRRQELESYAYNRWLDEGTLSLFTNQAMITLTTDNAPEHLADAFLTQYIQICCLCLAQRASIINFQRQTSALSARMEERGRQIRLATISALMTMQERFVAFQNQLNFTEITPQQQGIEVYNKIMEQCYIDKEKEALKDQLDALCNAANTSLDFNFNKFALIFAVPTIILDMIGFVLGEAPDLYGNSPVPWPHLSILAFATLCAVYFIIKYRRRK